MGAIIGFNFDKDDLPVETCHTLIKGKGDVDVGTAVDTLMPFVPHPVLIATLHLRNSRQVGTSLFC